MSEAPKSASEVRASEAVDVVRKMSVDELKKRVVDDGRKLFQMLRRRTEAARWLHLKGSDPQSVDLTTFNEEFDRRSAYVALINSNPSFTDYLSAVTRGEPGGPVKRIAALVLLGMEHMKGATPEDMATFIALDVCDALEHHEDTQGAMKVLQVNKLLERDFRNFFGMGEIPNNYFIRHESRQEDVKQILMQKLTLSAKHYASAWADEVKANQDLPEEERLALPMAKRARCIGFAHEIVKMDASAIEEVALDIASVMPFSMDQVLKQAIGDDRDATEIVREAAEERDAAERELRPIAIPIAVRSGNVIRRPGQRKEDLSGESTAEILNNIKRFVRTDFGGQDAHDLIMSELAHAGLPATQGVADFVIHKMRSVASGIQKRISPRIEELRRRDAQPAAGGAQ